MNNAENYIDTLAYYDNHAKEFVAGTMHVDFRDTQNRFLNKLTRGDYILDFGCGSGRDTKCFLEKGYKVDAVDGSEELCRMASAYTGIDVRHMRFHELEERQKYDGIWACSSILHLSYDGLKCVLRKVSEALKSKGIVYASFKYGDYEGERNGRYFIDMTEKKIARLLQNIDGLELEETWITSDVRPGRDEEKWLNIILRKKI